ncbi:MAG TPA: DUF4232 domain-containing protein [Streptosporangiaceae bacterium]|nr:DUF4232 domain-containing protein [Streptosporangiaceae bacterium]
MPAPLAPARPALAAAVLACTAGLLTACSSGGSPSAGAAPTVTVTSTAPAGGGTAAGASSAGTGGTGGGASGSGGAGGPAPCATAGLRVTTGQANGAAGSVIVPLEFSNTGTASCTLYGYPGVSFVTGQDGSQIGASAGQDPATPRQQVTLAPGGTAHALLQVAVAQNFPATRCKPATAHLLKVYPPGQTAALYVSYTAATCSNPSKAVRTLMVQTVQPGAGGS